MFLTEGSATCREEGKDRGVGVIDRGERMKSGSRRVAKSGISQSVGHSYSMSMAVEEVPGRMLSCCSLENASGV